jgi:hypothetical protein
MGEIFHGDARYPNKKVSSQGLTLPNDLFFIYNSSNAFTGSFPNNS